MRGSKELTERQKTIILALIVAFDKFPLDAEGVRYRANDFLLSIGKQAVGTAEAKRALRVLERMLREQHTT